MNFDWHRAFGLILTDQLTGTPFDVETNRDISIKEQLLDVVVIRRRPGVMTEPLPDGFEPLADHNLITFKSFREPLDPWALDELLGYYVGYRKSVNPKPKEMLEADRFRLYAVATRYPEKLGRDFELKPVRDGVYDCGWGSKTVRLIVVKELPRVEPNAGLALLSADPEQIEFGRDHYRQKDPEISSFLRNLISAYRSEGVNVPKTVKELIHEFNRDFVAGLSPEELSKVVPLEERLASLTIEERLEGIPPERRLQGLTREEIEQLFRSLQQPPSSEPPT